jgi:hypothetical protein
LQNDSKTVRITIAGDETFTPSPKKIAPGSSVDSEVSPQPIPVDGPFFIAVDFFTNRFDGSMKVIPLHFPIASVSGAVGFLSDGLATSGLANQASQIHEMPSRLKPAGAV